MTRGLIVAAPASGSGKTTVTLGLLRHLRNSGLAVGSAKVGPDYIDPAFHSAATGRPCLNLDSWAMRPETLATLLDEAGRAAELVIAEGVMGLFDGTATGAGSTAELARLTGWPVLLVIDARGMAASAAAVLRGFAGHDPTVEIAGVVFNRIGGERHAELLRSACGPLGIPVLGCLPRDGNLALPDRHLGLVQAAEHGDLEAFLETAAAAVARHLDGDGVIALARPLAATQARSAAPSAALPPLGQRISVASDAAFGFSYPFVLEGWRRAGAEISLFSPLAGQGPEPAADAVYLPGGYPELHAGQLAAQEGFLAGLAAAAARGATLYGECGGYMVLGRGLVDGGGERHRMAGLLPVETSFAAPKLSLGYRRAALAAALPLGARGDAFRGHEFHFARLESASDGDPLFTCQDAEGRDLGPCGSVVGQVMGSFVHLIDSEAPTQETAAAEQGRSGSLDRRIEVH